MMFFCHWRLFLSYQTVQTLVKCCLIRQHFICVFTVYQNTCFNRYPEWKVPNVHAQLTNGARCFSKPLSFSIIMTAGNALVTVCISRLTRGWAFSGCQCDKIPKSNELCKYISAKSRESLSSRYAGEKTKKLAQLQKIWMYMYQVS